MSSHVFSLVKDADGEGETESHAAEDEASRRREAIAGEQPSCDAHSNGVVLREWIHRFRFAFMYVVSPAVGRERRGRERGRETWGKRA